MSNKPAWLKDAVATTAGWVNPRTNELLLCVKGLPDALPRVGNKIVWPEVTNAKPEAKPEAKKPGRPKKVEEVVVEPAAPEVDVVEEIAPEATAVEPSTDAVAQ